MIPVPHLPLWRGGEGSGHPALEAPEHVRNPMRLALLLAFALALSGCAPGSASLLYCMAVDHDINRKCQ